MKQPALVILKQFYRSSHKTLILIQKTASTAGTLPQPLSLIKKLANIVFRTALHWAAKRGHCEIVNILLNHGANSKIEAHKGETPGSLCTNPSALALLGIGEEHIYSNNEEQGNRFTPNYIRNPAINGQVDIGKLRGKPDFSAMPTTTLPALLNDGNVLFL